MKSSSDSLYITIEKLPHVKRLVVIAWGVPAEINLERNRTRISIPTDSVEILFDCHVEPNRARSTPSNSSIINLTCPITLDMKRDHDLDLPSANELSSRQDLLCRQCDRILVHVSTLDQILPLPSEHWVDMSELWVCDPHSMSSIDRPFGLPNQRLDECARENIMLVGTRELLVPSSAFVGQVKCECGSQVAELIPGGYRLFKRCIRVTNEPLFMYYTIDTDAVASILQHCHSKSRYMIELSNPVDQCLIYLQICNWDSFAIQSMFRVIDGKFQLEWRVPSNEKRFAPTLKVLFSIQERSAHLPSSFASACQFERMQLTQEQFTAVSKSLVRSNSTLPPSQRQLGDMSIGILPRLSRIL